MMPANVYPEQRILREGEIRLIRLLPGSWNDDIKCELIYDMLETARPYYSLSYVWGTTKNRRKISLSSEDYFITINLESALRHLRTQFANAFFWIDALCINQIDITERTRQVKIMGDIYRSSQSVLVYLGDGVGRDGRLSRSTMDQTAPPTFTFSDYEVELAKIRDDELPSLARVPESENQDSTTRNMQDTRQVFNFIQSLCGEDHLHVIHPFTSTSFEHEEGKALINLFENLRQLMHAPFTPWWQRIWVVQEVVMPPDITVLCGTVSAPWKMFATAAPRCLKHLNHCCSRYMESFPRDVLNVLKDFCQRILDIDDLRSARKPNASFASPEHTILAGQESRHSRTERSSLISLLRRFRGRKATDPRDKVYALLSLVQTSTNWPKLIPDYSLSDSEVYIKAALQSIYESASLSVLSIDATRKFRQDLPTWVPDWEAPGDYIHNDRIDMIQLYDTCASHKITFGTVQLDERALLTQGRYVDEITNVGNVMLSDTTDLFRETIESWLKQWDEVIKNTRTELSSKWAVWHVLCAEALNSQQELDAGNAFRRTTPDDELMFVTWNIYSKRSPFFDKPRNTLVPSSRAAKWVPMVDFLTAVKYKYHNRAGQYLAILFEDEAARKHFLLDAFKLADKEGEINDELIRTATLTFEQYTASVSATSTDGRRISNEEFKKHQLKSWEKVPWDQVLQVVKPELGKRLGSASNLLDIPLIDQASIMDRSITSATKARRLFFTASGFVGLGPADLEEGDKLFLIKGGRTPFVLREDEKYRKEHEIFGFQLVGDSYVYGLMDSGRLLEIRLETTRPCWREWATVHLV